MRTTIYILAAMCLFLPTASADEKAPKELDFTKQGMKKFVIPKGWKLLKTEQKGANAWCVLQKDSDGKVKPTIGIWAGEEFKKPVRKQKAIFGAIDVHQKLYAWALGTPEKDVPVDSGAKVAVCKLGGMLTWYAESETESRKILGLCDFTERRGGPLMTGCVAPPDAFDETKKTLEQVLNATVEK